MTVQGALEDKSIEINEDALSHLKYDPESVSAYIEVCGTSSYLAYSKCKNGTSKKEFLSSI